MQEIFSSENIGPFEIEKKYQENPALALIDMKEFVIGHMRDVQTKMYKNNHDEIEQIKQRFLEIERKLDCHNLKIEGILDESQINKNKIEKINDLVVFSKKTTDNIMTLEIKLNSLQKEFSNACYKYDKIYLDNLNLPGTIGEYCRYKNLRDYIENSITQVQNLISYKEKNTTEFKIYKEKFENLVTGFSSQLENLEKCMRTYTSKMLQDTEVNFKREYDNIGVRIGDMRMENNKYAYQLQKNANELNIEKDKVLNLKNDIEKQLDDVLLKCKDMNKNTIDNFESIKGEYQSIKNKFIELSEFIKDVRFRRNLGVDINKSDIKKLTKKITSDSKKSNNMENKEFFNKKVDISNQQRIEDDLECNSDEYNVESYVKEYINCNSHVCKIKNSDSQKPIQYPKNKNKLEIIETKKKEIIDCTSYNYNIKSNNDEYFKNIDCEKNIIREETEEIENLKKSENYEIEYKKNTINLMNNKDENSENQNLEKNNENVIISKKETDNNLNVINKVIKNLDINIDDNENKEKYSNDSENSFHMKQTPKQNPVYKTSGKQQNEKLNFEKKNFLEKSSTENILESKSEKKIKDATSPEKVNVNSKIDLKKYNLNSSNSSNNLNITVSNLKSSKKFKDKFPSASNKNLLMTNNTTFDIEKLENEDNSNKKNYLATDFNISNNIKNSGINQKELNHFFNEFNENISSLKKEFIKKFSSSDQKINQIENFSKKKFEELANQIKNYLPINFNPYFKDSKGTSDQNLTTKINQLNVENLIINENITGNQNFALNVVDTSNIKLPNNLNNINRKQIKTVVLNKNNNNSGNYNKTGRNGSANSSRPILREISRNFPNLNTTNLQPAINQVNNIDIRIDESDFVKEYSFIENVTKISKSKEKLPNYNPSNMLTNPKIDLANVPKNHFMNLNSVLTNKQKNTENKSYQNSNNLYLK